MSEENVEIVRQLFADFADRAPALAIDERARAGSIAPDAVLDFSTMYPDGLILHGPEAWVDYVESMPWGRSLRLEPERFFDADDERVTVFVHVTAVGQTSRVPVDMRSAYEFTIRDGVVVRWKIYADRDEALDAAGLSE